MNETEEAECSPATVADITDADFEQSVLKRSAETPVLVDFWAPWCGPCRSLTPVLEAAVAARGGDVILAKVNVDENSQTAGRYGVRGIPAVKAFVDGKVVAEFTGLQDRSAIDQFIDSVSPRDPGQRALNAARKHLEAGAFQDAVDALAPALESRQITDAALLLQGTAYLRLGNVEAAEEALGRIDPAAEESEQAQNLRLLIDLSNSGKQNAQALEVERTESPENAETRWALAGAHYTRGEVAEALEHLLELLQRDRGFKNDGARRALLAIFSELDPEDDRVHEFRRRMQIYL